MRRVFYVAFFISSLCFEASLGAVSGRINREPYEEVQMEDKIRSYLPAQGTAETQDLVPKLVKLNSELHASISRTPFTLKELLCLERPNESGDLDLVFPNALLLKVAAAIPTTKEEKFVIQTAQEAWAHRPFYIDGRNLETNLYILKNFSFLTYVVMGPGLDFSSEYFNILLTRKLTGFGYLEVTGSPLMQSFPPHKVVFENSRETLRYFFVDQSSIFQANDIQTIPFAATELWFSNQSDLAWNHFKNISPLVESLTLLYNPQIKNQIPSTITWPQNLSSLTLDFNEITTEFIGNLPKALRKLKLEGVQHLPKSSLQKLPNTLKWLRLKNCQFCEERLFNSFDFGWNNFVSYLNYGLSYLEVNNCPDIKKEDLTSFASSYGHTLVYVPPPRSLYSYFDSYFE
ncbi:hypothetical protein Bealeia1_01557 [Candidatus Bealeia paramacronuclearis]|uniref:Leucine-rich repeat domain-containing protein n=1 Tax=Candidatus Bealeia paramacronuclearis TaxID=1921001 RepID=A0ABZ2C4H1_9PROT|nr:hypothetical protein [Candidatus Bealeia paramacronuclearis]